MMLMLLGVLICFVRPNSQSYACLMTEDTFGFLHAATFKNDFHGLNRIFVIVLVSYDTLWLILDSLIVL